MDLSSLSDGQSTHDLRSLQRGNSPDEHVPDNVGDLISELHVRRVELEMQNRALRESAAAIEAAVQRYSDLYDHLPIGYLTLSRNGRILQANLTAAGWLRQDRLQLVGGYFNWFLDAFDAGRFAAHLDACVQTSSEQALEITLRPEGGMLMTVQLTSRCAPVEADREIRVNTAIANISKLQQANTVLEDISREQEKFTQCIAHDLQLPLGTVSKIARSILQEHGAVLNPEVAGMVERMECAAVRMESMFQHLLDYCFGGEEVALDPVSLEELMQHVVMEQRGVIERNGADVWIDRPLPCVRGARLALGHVLAIVLSNALKRTNPLQAKRVHVSAMRQDSEVVLTVSYDEGTSAEKLNEENFRVYEQRYATNQLSETKLGIAIVRRTIERMRGRVWVQSEVGKPTCFSIGLPSV